MHFIIIPMKPVIYADLLPNSVPLRLRKACMACSDVNSPLAKLARELHIFYPISEMMEQRDQEGFFPKANYHPTGLSLKIIRDAYLNSVGASAIKQETMKLVLSESEILKAYRIGARYPVYMLNNPDVSQDEVANAVIANKIADLFVGPPTTRVFTNTSDTASGTVLLFSDSLGFAASPVFAGGFKRLIWVYTNGMVQKDIPIVIDRVAAVEHVESVVMMMNQGAIGRFVEWGKAVSAAGQ